MTEKMTTTRNEIDDTCNRLPDLHLSPRNITRCMSLSHNDGDRLVKVHIHLTMPKQRTFRVSLSGMGLVCSPIGRIVLSTISINGISIRCNCNTRAVVFCTEWRNTCEILYGCPVVAWRIKFSTFLYFCISRQYNRQLYLYNCECVSSCH